MVSGLINANPTVYEKKERRIREQLPVVGDEYAVEPIDELEIFDILFAFSFLFFDKLIFRTWNNIPIMLYCCQNHQFN